MGKGVTIDPDAMFGILDTACQYVPSFLSWSCGKSAHAFLAVIVVVTVFSAALSLLFSLKATKYTLQKIRSFFVSAFNEAFAEPELKGWLAKLPPKFLFGLFWFLCGLSVFVSLISFLYSLLGWYPIFSVPLEKLKYGVFSYIALLGFSVFFTFYGVLSVGMARQYYRLTIFAKMQLNKSLNRRRKKRRAG